MMIKSLYLFAVFFLFLQPNKSLATDEIVLAYDVTCDHSDGYEYRCDNIDPDNVELVYRKTEPANLPKRINRLVIPWDPKFGYKQLKRPTLPATGSTNWMGEFKYEIINEKTRLAKFTMDYMTGNQYNQTWMYTLKGKVIAPYSETKKEGLSESTVEVAASSLDISCDKKFMEISSKRLNFKVIHMFDKHSDCLNQQIHAVEVQENNKNTTLQISRLVSDYDKTVEYGWYLKSCYVGLGEYCRTKTTREKYHEAKEIIFEGLLQTDDIIFKSTRSFDEIIDKEYFPYDCEDRRC